MSDERIKILLVEDDPEFSNLVCRRLSYEKNPSFDIECVTTIKQGLDYLKNGTAEVVLLDLSLPDSQGIATFQVLYAAAHEIPIIVLTALDNDSIALESIKLGAEEYIVKGDFEVKMLSRIVRYAIERHQIRNELNVANLRLNGLVLLDPLTELLNRRGLQEILSREVQRAKRESTTFIAFLVDIDNFKQINDTFGYVVGDIVLKEVAQRLRGSLRTTDYAARIGGDEFMILLPQTRLAEAMMVAERVRLTLSQEPIFVLSRGPFKVTISLGVATVSEETLSIDELLTKTYISLYKSKEGGKNKVSYEHKMGQSRRTNQEEHVVLPDVLGALREGNRFQILAQPIIELSGGKKLGYEFLSRLSVKGFELPDDFFRLCVENNILTFVDHRCFKTCIGASCFFPLEVQRHVNLFPSTLINVPIQHLIETVPENSFEKSYCIEISEQQIIGDPSYLVGAIEALKKAGILVAIDDVGFGRSCLESLILLEPDIVKVDKKCITGVARDELRLRSLKRILKVTDGLGMEVIAEGIETEEDLALVKELGIKYGQGFLWGKPAKVPMPPSIFNGSRLPRQGVRKIA